MAEPAHDETSSGTTSPSGGPHGGHSGAEPTVSDSAPPTRDVVVTRDKRPNEFWLAVASSVVALVIGAIATGSGWYTVNQHDKQETQRQQLSSTRLQQKDAYTGFINSASDVAIAIQLQVKAIENRYPYFLYTPIPETKADLETRFTDLGHALDLAQLYGSAHVRDRSNEVFDAAGQSRFVVIGWNISHPGNDPTNAPCPELLDFEKKTESNRQQLGNAIERFSDAAREDLGIPALPPTSIPSEPLLPQDACANFPH
jgi:hypothetical protein